MGRRQIPTCSRVDQPSISVHRIPMAIEEELHELLRLSRLGDTEAREQLLDVTRPRLQIMIRARLGTDHRCWHLVEDLTQDVQLALADYLPTLTSDAPTAFRALLSRLVRNKVVDHIRREGRQPYQAEGVAAATLATATALEALQRVPASATSPSGHAARAEQIDLVLAAMANVSERHRQVLTLAFFDELETAEIGNVMQITRAAAAMLLMRAIRALEGCRRRQCGESA